MFCFVIEIADPDRSLALLHVTQPVRSAIAALWALDEALGRVLAGTTDPMIGQLRLTWWHQAIGALPAGAAGEPVLTALGGQVVARGIAPAGLLPLVEGWEALLDPLPLTDEALAAFATLRGGTLWRLAGALLDADPEERVGEGWALADFAGRCSDPDTAGRAYAMAASCLTGRFTGPRALRMLARLARGDAAARQRRPRSWWTIARAAV